MPGANAAAHNELAAAAHRSAARRAAAKAKQSDVEGRSDALAAGSVPRGSCTGTAPLSRPTAAAAASSDRSPRKPALSKRVEYPGDPEEVARLLSSGQVDAGGRDAFGLPALHKFCGWDSALAARVLAARALFHVIGGLTKRAAATACLSARPQPTPSRAA